ncbi:MAG: hypothetical protein ACRC62_39615 [Microcoleus sp.]
MSEALQEPETDNRKWFLPPKLILLSILISLSYWIVNMHSKERHEAVDRHAIYNLPLVKAPAAQVKKHISILPWESEPYIFQVSFQYNQSKNVTISSFGEIKSSSAKTYANTGDMACVQFKEYKNEIVELDFCD